MSDPTKASDLLPHVHRLVTPQQRGIQERSWRCKRCEDRGVVRETVTMVLGQAARMYQSMARCRCPAGEKQSPTIAVCSDVFWWGVGLDMATVRPDEPPTPSTPPPEQTKPTPPETPWSGTVAEEWDP